MAKKNWISVFHSGSIENTNTEQIYWDSSGSEDEHFMFEKPKRKKLSEVNSRPIITFQKNNFRLKEEKRSLPSNRSLESPVVGIRRLELYKVSPEFSQRSASIFVKEPSPVLEKRRVRLKKKRHKSKENHLTSCPSPDLFNFESTQNIISVSPKFSAFSSQATINIEPFPSQFSSQVEPTDIKIKDISLYYEPPKRKKHYKKGGIAHQLDKALKLKKSRVKIWHHEQVNNLEGGLEDKGNIIRCKMKKIWNEYGNTLLLCQVINSNITTEKDEDNKSDSRDDIVLFNLGASSILATEWKKDTIYNFFPPYDIGRVKYFCKDILYYSNIFKYMACEM